MNFDLKKLGLPHRCQPNATREEVFAGYSERSAKLLSVVSEARTRVRNEYARRRRCTHTKADEQPCGSWAVWEADEQKCLAHLSPQARSAHETRRANQSKKTVRPVCDCEAYPFPHRPANGFCVAPEKPKVIHPLPAGQRKAGRQRRRDAERAQKRWRF